MDRLLSLEPTNEVAIRIEPGQRCFGKLTLRNVMYTMPVAFRLQPLNRSQYSIKPQSGIIPPLATRTVEITYVISTNSCFQAQLTHSTDAFLLDSVVVPGASFKDSLDLVPQDWFTTGKKQVFTDSGVKVFFIGSGVLTKLVAEGSMDRIREVLERSDPEWHSADSTDLLGQSLLHIAISQCRADIVQLLLEFDPNVEACNRAGHTPLEAAAAAGEALIVELLLAHGASTEKLSTSAWGAVHFAAAGGHLEVMQLLLLKGADVNLLTKDGLSALHLSVQEHRYNCARLLIVSGARADIRGGAEGNTPLHVVAYNGDERMVKLLLSIGCAGLKEVRNLAGKTAYDAAVDGGHGRLFDVLQLGTELALAAKKGDVPAVERMVEKGASVNGRDQYGWTALMRAGFKGKVEVMKGLFERGADIDASDVEGYTVLHCAVEAGQVEVVEMLVKRGADLEVKTKKGANAMQIASSLGYVGITRILAQGGANVVDGEGNASVLEKKQVTMSGRNKGKGIHNNEARKTGSKLSFVSEFDRMAMAVASH